MTRSRKPKLERNRTPLALSGVPLASTLLGAVPVAMAQESTTDSGGLEEVVVSAQKRDESLQKVPLSITALGNEALEELHITNFSDFVKFLPSVSYQSTGPGFSLPYMRGVASGENANHSGPQPTVGIYLDEQPITTIQGALDVHVYDIARVEALAGPQGTLYGASSQAGTIRIITNKPDPSAFKAGYDFEGNTVQNGDQGYVGEGFVNIPLGENAAVRLVGWYDHDAGYIDNVPSTRFFEGANACISNGPVEPGCLQTPGRAKDAFNEADTYGARAALRINLNDNWTITPTIMAQDQRTTGTFAYAPESGDLKVSRFYPDKSVDRWMQTALTIEGKVGNLDLVYAGAFLKRDDVLDSDYSDYSFFYDAVLYGEDGVSDGFNPSQYIHGVDGYKKTSHEFRITSNPDNRFRYVAGVFMQRQEHNIRQEYIIDGLSSVLHVTGWPNTLWLTNQLRVDRDKAVFGEVTFDFTDKLAGTAGLRYYDSDNTLRGFFGFNENYYADLGEAQCFSEAQFEDSPCTNIDGQVKEDGSIGKVNLTYQFDETKMGYVTWSEGFRPGGLNRNGSFGPYGADYLTNYELGWKTSWAGNRVRFNGAVFVEDWDDIQFSFLPPGGFGLTVIKNAGAARIKGIEGDLAWAATDALTISAGVSFIDAKLTQDYIQDDTTDFVDAPSGMRLPVSPKFKGNVVGRYEFGLGAFDAHLQAALVHQGQSFSDFLPADREFLGDLPAYTVGDLAFGIAKESYALELFVNNVSDERAEIFKFAQCATDVCAPNPYVVTLQPRTIGIKFSQKF